MTAKEFAALLKCGRPAACRFVAEMRVEDWLNDGKQEAVRCLGLWMGHGLNLGDDRTLADLAEPYLED